MATTSSRSSRAARPGFYRTFLLPTGLLTGEIIGAGMFALPFVFARVGFALGLLTLAAAAIAYTVIYLLYADILVRTNAEHRFVGYLRQFFSSRVAPLGIAMTVITMAFVMGIFLVLVESFVHLVAPAAPLLAGPLMFWAVSCVLIFSPIKRLKVLELLVVFGMLLIIAAVFIFGLSHGEAANLASQPTGDSASPLPLGVILFALAGRAALPTMVEHFMGLRTAAKQKKLRRSIIAGTLVPAAVYVLFTIGVLALSFPVTEDAVSGLAQNLPLFPVAALGILGLLSLLSTYLIIGVNVKDILTRDMDVSRVEKVLVVVLAPLAVYALSSANFVSLVSFAGGVFLALEGLIIIAMWKRANSILTRRPVLFTAKHKLLIAMAAFVFALALVSEFVRVFFT
ncbi:MAG: hypothetical protein HY536_00500 [Candidatus Colwellbacteria bacterium]|nr:hypothetical protein [Candidatus Colwellbacteria bacterium]